MTRTIITPENNSILLPVPDEYVGKKLEVLIYAVEELSENKPQQKTMEFYKGILTSEEAQQLQRHVKQSREEWDNNI
jgi:hypothetical protein